jgi:hypothetical protein
MVVGTYEYQTSIILWNTIPHLEQTFEKRLPYKMPSGGEIAEARNMENIDLSLLQMGDRQTSYLILMSFEVCIETAESMAGQWSLGVLGPSKLKED